MRLTIALLLLAVTARAEFENKKNFMKTEKRALTEGNAGLKKRTPALSTATTSLNAGIEYADTKQTLTDKSPAQRVYATPLPQIAKISDLLASQNPSFQTAIANQLFAPVSVYQPRSGTPTTYEVSAPVPSQLAYSEHRVAYQQPNAVQQTPQIYTQNVPQQQDYLQQQQILAQTQQIYNQQPQLQQIYQQIPQANYQSQLQYNQIPQANYQPQLQYNEVQPDQYSAQQLKQLNGQQALQAVQYQQSPKTIQPDNQQNLLSAQYNLAPQTYYTEGQQQYQQPAYVQEQQVQNIQYLQPSVSRPEETQQKIFSQPEQNRVYEKQQQQFVTQNYQAQQQGPVSFVSFSNNQLNPSIVHHPYHQQIQQSQFNSQDSLNALPQGNAGHGNQLSYFRPGPQLQIQPQVHQAQLQPQVYQQAQQQVQYSAKTNAGYRAQAVVSAPTFPAVQYFGKYAQSIFGKSQH